MSGHDPASFVTHTLVTLVRKHIEELDTALDILHVHVSAREKVWDLLSQDATDKARECKRKS